MSKHPKIIKNEFKTHKSKQNKSFKKRNTIHCIFEKSFQEIIMDISGLSGNKTEGKEKYNCRGCDENYC